MSFVEDLQALGTIGRRLEQYRLQFEGEIAKLKEVNRELQAEVHRLRERREPSARKIAEDCKNCVYRVQVLRELESSKTEDKDKSRKGVV